MQPMLAADKQVESVCISNDQVRLELMEEYLREHPKARQEDAVVNSRDQLQNKIEQLIIQSIDEFIENNDDPSKQLLIYVDKNFTISSLERLRFFANAV